MRSLMNWRISPSIVSTHWTDFPEFRIGPCWLNFTPFGPCPPHPRGSFQEFATCEPVRWYLHGSKVSQIQKIPVVRLGRVGGIAALNNFLRFPFSVIVPHIKSFTERLNNIGAVIYRRTGQLEVDGVFQEMPIVIPGASRSKLMSPDSDTMLIRRPMFSVTSPDSTTNTGIFKFRANHRWQCGDSSWNLREWVKQSDESYWQRESRRCSPSQTIKLFQRATDGFSTNLRKTTESTPATDPMDIPVNGAPTPNMFIAAPCSWYIR